jgi:hypothetical protein
MSEFQILNANSVGTPVKAIFVKLQLQGVTVNSPYGGTWFLPPLLDMGTAVVNTRNGGATFNKTLNGVIQFNKTTKVLNNPVTFVNTLSDARPTQGRIYPIVR